MDEYSRRRAGGGLVFSRKASNLVLTDSSDNQDRNTQICTPIRFGSKLNPEKNIQIGCAEKAKSVRQSFRSSTNGKEIIGSSSRTSSTIIHSPKRASTDLRKKYIAATTLETDSETSSVQLDEGEVSESSHTPQGELRSKGDVEHHQDMVVSTETAPSESGSSSLIPYSSRHGKRIAQRSGLGNPDTPPSSSMSLTFRDIKQGTRVASGISRYSMRNFKCNLVSDVIQSGCSSSSESSLGRKRDMGRERNGEAESSSFSAKGKKISVPLLDKRRNDNENRGISISDSRRMRNMIFGNRDNEAVSVRTRRSTVRTRLFDQEYSRNRLHLNEEPIFSPVLLPQPDISLVSNALCRLSEASSSSSSSNTNQPGSNRGLISRSFGQYDVGMARSFMSRDGLRQYSLDGVAEVLLALERIEQDEELTYEQLLVLERNLFLGTGLPFHDQHRDMRMDIDNMSYEELLALEERMGNVSTALSEESIAKCLETSSHQASRSDLEAAATKDKEDNDNDIKCSICQEEYSEGDEVGRLECQHRYHVECIQQWLRLKNWCPICKISAATPDS